LGNRRRRADGPEPGLSETSPEVYAKAIRSSPTLKIK
jgi:hypothetical protein